MKGAWGRLSPWQKGAAVALAALGTGLLLALGAALYYGGVVADTLDQVTSRGPETRALGVYVLAEDPAQTLEDAKGYRFAGVEGDPLEGDALSLTGAGELLRYPTAFALADALEAGACDAIFLEEGLAQSLGDAPDYAWTQKGLRKLSTLSVEAEGETAAVQDQLPEQFVAYLSGIDSFGARGTRSRSDVNLLAAVNTADRKLLLLATPRDFYVDFPASGGEKDKLTHAGLYGVEESTAALEGLYGVEVSCWFRMNFTGFVELIDALGGVEVWSDQAFTVEPIKSFQQGYNQVTGLEALAFARERYSFAEGDYQRAKNQMALVQAVVDKCASLEMLGRFRQVMEAVGEHLETNLSSQQLYALAAGELGAGKGWEISTYTAWGESAYRETWSMPGQELYVILPEESSLEEARELLQETLGP